jgi:glycosyltransferase involved in cell wall biosynthesis
MIFKPLVLLPTYNSGHRLAQTLREAHAHCHDVWVSVDGGADGSDHEAESLGLDGVRFLRLPRNSGKGSAVLAALKAAQTDGFTHMLVMDADGQHPAAMIEPFFEISKRNPTRIRVRGFRHSGLTRRANVFSDDSREIFSLLWRLLEQALKILFSDFASTRSAPLWLCWKAPTGDAALILIRFLRCGSPGRG